jgi:hypothetical protein
MFASSLLIRRSSSSFALAFLKSDMKVVKPLIVVMLSVANRLPRPLVPPPPGLRIESSRFRTVDYDDGGEEASFEGKRKGGTCFYHLKGKELVFTANFKYFTKYLQRIDHHWGNDDVDPTTFEWVFVQVHRRRSIQSTPSTFT